jgi:ribosomal protein L11 methyltransferase
MFAADAFTEALEPLVGAVTWFMPEGKETEVRVEAYAAAEPDMAALRDVLAVTAAAFKVAPPHPDVTWLPSRDWLAENKQAFEPFSVGRFFVHGSDYEGPVPLGQTALEVDAGLAFGSGRHESTAGCLRALTHLSQRRFRRPLDMGCGSGILALALAKTRHIKVLAADIDPSAVRVARENAAANGVGSLITIRVADGYGVRGIGGRGPFDLIVANILADPLCRMARDLGRHLAPGGFAVLAGFVAGDANRVYVAHRWAGLRLVRRIDVGGWRTLVLRKPRRII